MIKTQTTSCGISVLPLRPLKICDELRQRKPNTWTVNKYPPPESLRVYVPRWKVLGRGVMLTLHIPMEQGGSNSQEKKNIFSVFKRL